MSGGFNLPGMSQGPRIAFGGPLRKEKPALKPKPKLTSDPGPAESNDDELGSSGGSTLLNDLNESLSRHSNTNKTTSRMGFGTDLQAKSCHDALLKLSEHEIRMLETMKKCLTLRVKYDKDYATALSGFISTAGKIDADNNTHESPVFSAWTTIVKQTQEISQLIKRNSESITENVINKLNTIIKEKIEIKRTYNHERNKLDGDFSKISDEVNDNYNKYVKSAKETQDARNKFEEVVNRGKGEKDVEKMKDKLRKATVKIHKIHNEYVLSIKAAEVHQDHYRSTMLPRLLDMHQQAQESHVSQIKDLLYKYASLTNFSSENYRNAFDTIDGSIKEINPEQEYNTFIEQYSSDFPEAIEFAFKTDLEDEYQDDYLKADEIAVDNLTIETVTHRHTELSDELTKCQENISEKETELENLDIEIRSISPTEAEDTMISDLLDKQKTYREVFKSLGELKCLEAKLTAQYTALNTKLEELGDATPPAGIEFAYADVSKGSTLPSNKTNKSDSLGKKEKEKEKKKKAATKFFKKKPKQDGDHSSQGPSEEGEEYSEVPPISPHKVTTITVAERSSNNNESFSFTSDTFTGLPRHSISYDNDSGSSSIGGGDTVAATGGQGEADSAFAASASFEGGGDDGTSAASSENAQEVVAVKSNKPSKRGLLRRKRSESSIQVDTSQAQSPTGNKSMAWSYS